MIRRWSHLIFFNSNSLTPLFFKIEIFKASVNLKKFFFKITKFKRKRLAIWKHRSLWFSYLNLFKYWLIDYRFNINLIKCQFLYGSLNESFLLFDYLYMQKKHLPMSTNYLNFNLLSINKKIYFYFFKLKNYQSFFYKHYNLTFAFANSANPFYLNNKINILTKYYESSNYEHNDSKQNRSDLMLLHLIDQYLFLNTLFLITEFYKILSILFYIAISKSILKR